MATNRTKKQRKPDFLDDLFGTDFEEIVRYLPAEERGSMDARPEPFSREDVRLARTMGIVLELDS